MTMACIIENNGYPQVPVDEASKTMLHNNGYYVANNGVKFIDGYPVVYEDTREECLDWLTKNCSHDGGDWYKVDSEGYVITNGDGNVITYQVIEFL